MKQQKLFKYERGSDTRHGGGIRKGKRKLARPITTKSPMHVTLSSSRARGKWSFLAREREVENTIYGLAKKYRVRVYRFGNVGNHRHLGPQAATRRKFQSFLRVLTQALMFLITGARKGNPVGKFWDALVFSRIVHWGRDWNWVQNYIEKNRLQGKGHDRDRLDFIFKELWDSS